MAEIPQKSHYKLSEVCQYTDTQPYVLRFWEGEFPQLRAQKNPNGQRVYTRESIDLVQRIKRMLDHESRSIAEARELLESGAAGDAPRSPGTSDEPPSEAEATAPRVDARSDAASATDRGNGTPASGDEEEDADEAKASRRATAADKIVDDPDPQQPARLPIIEAAEQKARSFDGVARARYEDALEEISTLRLRVQELETSSRRLQTRVEQLESLAERERSRADRGVESLQEVLELLESTGRKA